METLEQTRTIVETFIKEKAPDIDLAPGSVFSELLANLQAQAQNEIRNQMQEVSAAKTVAAVLASPTDSYNPVIEQLASNYDTYRNEGKRTNGQIKVLVSKNKSYYIPNGLVFEQPNLNFKYATVTDYTISSTSVNKLKAEGEHFYFVVPVEALDVGKEKQVSNGTKFVISPNTFIPELIDAYAVGAFVNGESKETDKELITRFKLGLSTKNLVTPIAIESVLKDRFPNFKSVSVCGINDPESLRAKNNVLGIMTPGFVDVYVRTSYTLLTKTITLSGTKILNSPPTWHIDIPATTLPGFYKVTSIVKTGSNDLGTQKFTSTYDFDTELYTTKNDVNTVKEARFSKYQTCSVEFEYASSSTTDNFDVTFLYIPNIEDIQAIFLSDGERIPCADYLVKSIVPCNVSLKLKLVKANDLDTSVDITAIKTDIFNYVNSLKVGEALSASKIIDICHNYPIKRVDLPIQMTGSILVPYSDTDETLYVSDTDSLEIPYKPEKGVTSKTTAFFINYFDEKGAEAIGINVV